MSHFVDGVVTTTREFDAGQRYRIALVWLASGSFAFQPQAYHPYGYTLNMDLDLRILDPNGRQVSGSFSWDNGFELVDFTPSTSGTYTIEVRRYANSGTGKVNMAVDTRRVP